MKVLFLTKYTREGASSRYRTYQYLDRLPAEGVTCDVLPLFDEEYLKRRYQLGRTPLARGLVGVLRRFLALRKARRYDLVVLEKELAPFCPFEIERAFLRGAKYVVDVDDALFHYYDGHRSRLVRSLLVGKYAGLFRGASAIFAGNRYLEEFCRRHSERVVFMPTVVPVARYSEVPQVRSTLFTVGWIGTPHTQKYLASLREPLKAFFERRPGRLLLIGADSRFRLEGVPVVHEAWSEEREISLLRSIDVGIMPLNDGPIERGKSALKLLQYMASGKPVVASPVGENVHVVTPEVGFLASTADAWRGALETLYDHAESRARLGEAGHARVRSRYDLDAWAPVYAANLRRAADGD